LVPATDKIEGPKAGEYTVFGVLMIVSIQPVARGLSAPNADETLQPARFDFFSGNSCTVTPSMRRHGNIAAVAFAYPWKFAPTASDRQEMEAYVSRLMDGRNAILLGETKDPTEASHTGYPSGSHSASQVDL